MEKIEFTDYDRITDILMWLTDNITLNFVVVLSKVSKYDGKKKFFQYETMYGTDKYTNNPNRSIKRNMDFYFVLDNREVFANGLLIRPQDVCTISMIVDKYVMPWYFGKKQEQAFSIVDNKLSITEYTPITWAQSSNKYIVFEPYIFNYEDDTSQQGVKMTLHSGDIILLTIDKFLGFMYLLKSDMYSAACNNVTYAKMEPHGINVMDARGLGGGRISNSNNGWQSHNYNGNTFLNESKGRNN